MSDTFIAPDCQQVFVSGAQTAGLIPQRVLLPYPCAVVGVQISLATAPTGANFIIDVLHGPSQVVFNTTLPILTSFAYQSLWSINNVVAAGPPATVDNRPTIVAGNYDQLARTVTSTTRQSLGIPSIPITTTPYNEQPWLSIPDPNATAAITFEGTSPVYETEESPVQLESDSDGTNTAFTGGANYPQQAPNANYGFTCLAGDVLAVVVRQVGSTVAGSGLNVEIWTQKF